MQRQTPKDQYVKVGNVNTRFWKSGDSGSPVVLVSGLFASVETWAANIEALAEHHTVYAVDLVGFGRSDKLTSVLTPQSWAQFVKDFMDVQHVDQASIIGVSLAGMVSLQFAIMFPGRVTRLVLVDSAGLGKEVSFSLRLASVPGIGEILMRPSRKSIKRRMKNFFYDPSLVSDDMVETRYQISVQPGAKECFLSALRNLGSFFGGQRASITRPIVQSLPNVKVPTLVVWGKQDRVIPVAHAQIAARIPNSEVIIFDRCGHVPQIEHPEEFNRLVLDFLAK